MVTHFYTTITGTTSLITLEKAKKQLRLDASMTDEDDLIQGYIDSAQEAVQNFINRAITKQSFVMELNKFESPLVFQCNYENDTIAKIEYYAPGETDLTLLPSDQYKLQKANISECYEIKFYSTPETAERDDAVIITISQGFTLAECPKPLLQAMQLRLSDFYERREDREQSNNPASNNLARAYRKY